MPFYEYQCRACGAQVEVLQKITDAPLKKCPECSKNQLQKLVSAPVFRLAGGGWYETDFKTDKDKKRNLVEAGKDEAKGDGKPDAKADAKPAAADASAGKKDDSGSKPEAKPATRSEAKPAARPVKPAAKKKARR